MKYWYQSTFWHNEWKIKGKVSRRYFVKFQNYSLMDAKWIEDDLANHPPLLQLYLDAFQLELTLDRALSGSAELGSRVPPDTQGGGSTSTPPGMDSSRV